MEDLLDVASFFLWYVKKPHDCLLCDSIEKNVLNRVFLPLSCLLFFYIGIPQCIISYPYFLPHTYPYYQLVTVSV